MWQMRDREYTNKHRQLLDIIEYSVINDDVPIKENGSNRWYSLTRVFKDIMPELLDFDIKKDDVFVATFLKCGTTWMQETAWILLNNLNFEKAKQEPISERSPFLDWSGVFPHLPNSLEQVRNTVSPRLIKTHLPPHFMPKQVWQKKTKIIYVGRNVKDAVVSSFHFYKNLGSWTGNIDEYVDDFVAGELIYTPYLSRLIDFWNMRNEPNIFFVTYEEMKRDLGDVLQRLCKFLERPQLTDDEIKQTIDHLSFDKMRVNKQTNITTELKGIFADLPIQEEFEFMRRGIVGSYKDELSERSQRKLNEWSEAIFAENNINPEDIFGKI